MGAAIEYIYIPIILFLYFKTHRYLTLIDDPVPRGGYLLVVPTQKWPKEVYEKKRSVMATATNIGVFMATCFAIHHLWGWEAAVLYAVFPLNVSGVAWITGNYYMTTAFLLLATHYFALLFPKIDLAALVPISFYVAALGSTVSAIPYAFYMIIEHQYIYIIPLLFFLFGHRFRTGLKIRKERHQDIRIKAGEIHLKKIYPVIKCIGYSIFISLWPARLGFFHDFFREDEKRGKMYHPTRQFWWSIALIISFMSLAWVIDWKMAVWWILFCGIFSQFVQFGQFWAERYTYVYNIAFCVLLAKLLDGRPVLLAIVGTLYFCRSLTYIPAWKNNETLFKYSIGNFPKTPENYTNLSSLYLDYGRWMEAAPPLLMALNYVTVGSYSIHGNLVVCYGRSGMYEKALFHARMALKDAPESKKANLNATIKDFEDKLSRVKSNYRLLKKKGIV